MAHPAEEKLSRTTRAFRTLLSAIELAAKMELPARSEVVNSTFENEFTLSNGTHEYTVTVSCCASVDDDCALLQASMELRFPAVHEQEIIFVLTYHHKEDRGTTEKEKRDATPWHILRRDAEGSALDDEAMSALQQKLRAKAKKAWKKYVEAGGDIPANDIWLTWEIARKIATSVGKLIEATTSKKV